jgi:uncharacterized protein (DUF488 family)
MAGTGLALTRVFTIGFTGKTAAQFFGALRRAGIERVVDVRLNNVSQLAGFTKRQDLPFFLKELCSAEYVHEPILAPTKEILDDYRKDRSWGGYTERFLGLLRERQVEHRVPRELIAAPTALLCSEPTPDRCHRRLVAEYLAGRWGDIQPTHL